MGRCGPGLALLVGVHTDDDEQSAEKLANRVANLRVFNDPDGKMNLSIQDMNADGQNKYGFLVVSNFTVYGETKKNRRPSFLESAPYETGKRIFLSFVAALRSKGLNVATGVFGADMEVSIVNSGPVTLIVES